MVEATEPFIAMEGFHVYRFQATTSSSASDGYKCLLLLRPITQDSSCESRLFWTIVWKRLGRLGATTMTTMTTTTLKARSAMLALKNIIGKNHNYEVKEILIKFPYVICKAWFVNLLNVPTTYVKIEKKSKQNEGPWERSCIFSFCFRTSSEKQVLIKGGQAYAQSRSNGYWHLEGFSHNFPKYMKPFILYLPEKEKLTIKIKLAFIFSKHLSENFYSNPLLFTSACKSCQIS